MQSSGAAVVELTSNADNIVQLLKTELTVSAMPAKLHLLHHYLFRSEVKDKAWSSF